MVLVILNLLFFISNATPTPHASQSSPRSDELSPRIEPFYSAATALTNHPKRAPITRGTFYQGLWTLARTLYFLLSLFLSRT